MFKNIRVVVLLYVLLIVAVGAWLAKSRTTDWDKPLNVIVYAINGDSSKASQTYIDALDKTDFNLIEPFFEKEAERYNLALKKPVDFSYAGELKSIPPQPPRTGSTLSIMIWSLKLRYWAWKNDNYPYPEDVQIFVLYFDPDKNKRVAHSLGLQKGLIGVVNAFATETMKKQNHVVIAHELLHTVGATDKYDLRTTLPHYPIGYAEPERSPVFPQLKAEIMAGRIPINENKAEQPASLDDVLLGKYTAIEIKWVASGNKK